MPCDRFVVLCEDRRHESFVRAWLTACGLEAQRVRVKISPSGMGSAENFVRNQYAEQVKVLRSNAHQKHLGLTIIIDGDLSGFLERKGQLDESLAVAGLPRRASNEKICILVPSRNIETWAYHLTRGAQVNEADDYKLQVSNQDIRRAGGIFQAFQGVAPMPSLRDAAVERVRIGC